MGLPDDGLRWYAGEERVFFKDGEVDFAEFGDDGGFDFSSVEAGHELVSGADAQNGEGGFLEVFGAVS